MWVITGLEPVHDLRDCVIIHHATGVRLMRMRGRDRPMIPDGIIRLMRLINHSENLMPCVVCTTDNTNAKEGALFVCRLCLLPLHVCCSERLAAGVSRHGHNVHETATIRKWVQYLGALHNICAACRHVADPGGT